MTVWAEWSKLNDIEEPSLMAPLLQNLWDLLWNNENGTIFLQQRKRAVDK